MSGYSYPTRRRAKLAAWRLLNIVVDGLRLPIRRSELLLVTGNAPEAKIAEVETRLRFLFSHLDRTPSFQTASRVSLFGYIRNSAVVAVDASAIPERISRNIRWVADLDYETNPIDGWALMELGCTLSHRPQKKTIAASHRLFASRIRELKAAGPKPIYLFGTGPSLKMANERSFTDGITIVCNTIVRDPALWHKLRPAFFTAGDAIYHFGHNAHARAFRADALRRLKESDGRTMFVYPAPFDVIVRTEFREVEELLIPIPWGEHTDITVNLVSRFTLPRVGNVLNDLLLPLGCTLGSDIRLWGFDGRAPDDAGFWSNSTEHAYPELMQTIRNAHPAFFAHSIPAGAEFRYVNEVHGDWLDSRLSDAEARGFKFRMLHPSWTQTLQKRYGSSSSLS